MTTTIPQWLNALIDDLTPQQYAFVMSNDKMARYVAGPGYGKTHAGIVRCLRLAYQHPGIMLLACDATTADLALYLFDATVSFLPLGEIAQASRVRREIKLTNGSEIAFHYLAYGRRLNEVARGVLCDAIYLDNNEYLSYRDFLSLFLRAQRTAKASPSITSLASYTGEVEWRSWRELGPKEAIRAPMLEAGQYVDSDTVVVDAEDV